MYEGNTVIVSRWGVAMLSSEIVSVQDSNNSDEVDTTDNFSNKHPIVLTYDTLIIDVQSLISWAKPHRDVGIPFKLASTS